MYEDIDPSLGRVTKRNSRRTAKQKKQTDKKQPKPKKEKRKKYAHSFVEAVDIQVKLLRRFVAMYGKQVKSSRLFSYIKSLQRAIDQRLIRKSSKHSKLIDAAQQLAIEFANHARGAKVWVQTLIENTRNKKALEAKQRKEQQIIEQMRVAAFSQKVRPSVAFLSSFVGTVGLEPSRENLRKFESLVKSFDKHAEKGRIAKGDPYYRQVLDAVQRLKKAVSRRESVQIEPASLSGLNGIISGVYEQEENFSGTEDFSDVLYGTPQTATAPRSMSPQQIAEQDYPRLELAGFYRDIFNRPATNAVVAIFGPPQHGKTFVALYTAAYFADNFGDVLYITPEQYDSATLQDYVEELKLQNVNGRITFVKHLGDEDPRKFDFLVFDSVSAERVNIDKLTKLHEKYPDKFLLLVLQSTKDGSYRGTREWEHFVDIMLKVEDGYVYTVKNRTVIGARPEPVALPPLEKTNRPGTANDLQGTATKTAAGEKEIEASFSASAQWIAESVLKLESDRYTFVNSIEKYVRPMEKALRQIAEQEITDNKANVKLHKLRYDYTDPLNYYRGVVHFKAVLRGSPHELRKVAGGDDQVFVYDWK